MTTWHRPAWIVLSLLMAGGRIQSSVPAGEVPAPTRESVELTLEAGNESQKSGRYDSARQQFRQALKLATRLAYPSLQARSELALARLSGQERDSDTALAGLDRAQSLAETVGDPHLLAAIENERAWVFCDKGDWDQARVGFSRVLDTARTHRYPDLIAASLNGIGFVELIAADYVAATLHLGEAVDVSHRFGDLDEEGLALHNWARVQELQGEYSKAERLGRRSLELARRTRNVRSEFDRLAFLAMLSQVQGKYDRSRTLLLRAEQLAAEMQSPLNQGRVGIYLGKQQVDEGLLREAIATSQTALKKLRGISTPMTESDLLAIQAEASSKLGRYDEALNASRRAVERAHAAGRRDQEAHRRLELANLLHNVGDYESASAELEVSIRMSEEDGDTRAACYARSYWGRVRMSAGDLEAGTRILGESLRCFEREGDLESRSEAMLAMVEYGAPATTPEQVTEQLAYLDSARQGFTQLEDRWQLSLVAVLEAELRLGQGDSLQARRALDRIARFTADQRGSENEWTYWYFDAQTWLAAGQRRRAIKSCQRAIEAVESLRSAVREPRGRAVFTADTVMPYRLMTRLRLEEGDPVAAWAIGLRGKARGFTEKLEPDDSSWTKARLRPPQVSLARIQALIRDDEALVDWVATDRGFAVFVIKSDSFSAHPLLVSTNELDGLVRLAAHPGRPELRDNAVTNSWRAAIDRLGALLIDPIHRDLDDVHRLLFVPTGPLHSLPFVALPHDGEPLIRSKFVSILPGAEAILLRARALGRATGALVIGDPAATDRATSLPGAAREARAVAQRTGSNTRLAIGHQATEAMWREVAPGAGMIHIAAHGTLDLARPWRSRIELAASAQFDGALTADELASQRLQARLVVLSGCNTAREASLGRSSNPSDEREGLARAFLSAGVASVVASLWETEDTVGAIIGPALHDHLGPALDSAAALALVQRDLIDGRLVSESGEPLTHPFYWAGLASYGPGR